MLRDFIELISLGGTITNIYLAVVVVLLWLKATVDAVKRGQLDAQGWFITGVSIGFLGDALDSSYWLATWSAFFLDLTIAKPMMEDGVYANIPFRQFLGSVGAYCHIRAHYAFTNKENGTYRSITKAALLAGFLYCMMLVTANLFI